MIRPLLTPELGNEKLLLLGEKFYAEAKLPGSFKRDMFVNTWTMILTMNMGAMWVADAGQEFVGALGMVLHPDACDGELVAQEMFWFVAPGFRSGFNAVKLYDAAERWSKMMGAKRLAMASVLGPHAASLRKFYTARGFRPVDVSYFKDL